jgi:hypothetical protein
VLLYITGLWVQNKFVLNTDKILNFNGLSELQHASLYDSIMLLEQLPVKYLYYAEHYLIHLLHIVIKLFG